MQYFTQTSHTYTPRMCKQKREDEYKVTNDSTVLICCQTLVPGWASGEQSKSENCGKTAVVETSTRHTIHSVPVPPVQELGDTA